LQRDVSGNKKAKINLRFFLPAGDYCAGVDVSIVRGGIAGSSTGAISGNGSSAYATGTALKAKAKSKPSKSFLIFSSLVCEML